MGFISRYSAVSNSCQILGVPFFLGSAQDAVNRLRAGGLLVAPSGPGMKDLPENASYREALLGADVAITDSALMVTLWNLISRDSVPRVSGLEYLKTLLKDPGVRRPGNTLWVMASPRSARRNLDWLRGEGIDIPLQDIYMAPMYGADIQDQALLALLGRRHYRHVIVTVGGGTQEQLGLYIKQNLSYCPAIHCIGAAIAFLSGDQVRIPGWADRMRIGWLLRCLWRPGNYVPRYWAARKLVWLMFRYRSELPPFIGSPMESPEAAA